MKYLVKGIPVIPSTFHLKLSKIDWLKCFNLNQSETDFYIVSTRTGVLAERCFRDLVYEILLQNYL